MNKTFTNKSGNVILELRQEDASAWLTIKRTGRLVDEKDILDLIEEAGIKSGFDEALKMIRERGIEKDFDEPFPIAVCKRNTETKEAKLRYHFDPDAISNAGEEISLARLAKTSYVNEGDTIASYSDNLFERDGSIYDIFGQLITTPEVDEEEARSLAGRHVRYEAHDFVAETMGYPYLDEEGRMSILTELKVESSAVPKAEFIRSPLALEITGDLEEANIACARELTIHGDVRDCSIYCEKDLVIEGDLMVSINPGIQVLGNLKLHSIRNSRVNVKGNLEFQAEISNSTVALDGDLLGTDSDSRIVGGLCQAAGDIDIAIAGAADHQETEIEIAISPFYRAILMQMTKEAVRIRDDGNQEALDDLQKRMKRCETELDSQLNSFLKRPSDEKRSVTVREEVYPKTLFRILKHSYQIKSRQKGLYLLEKE